MNNNVSCHVVWYVKFIRSSERRFAIWHKSVKPLGQEDMDVNNMYVGMSYMQDSYQDQS